MKLLLEEQELESIASELFLVVKNITLHMSYSDIQRVLILSDKAECRVESEKLFLVDSDWVAPLVLPLKYVRFFKNARFKSLFYDMLSSRRSELLSILDWKALGEVYDQFILHTELAYKRQLFNYHTLIKQVLEQEVEIVFSRVTCSLDLVSPIKNTKVFSQLLTPEVALLLYHSPFMIDKLKDRVQNFIQGVIV